MKYKIHKSDKSKSEAGKYQILECIKDKEVENLCRCAGIYFNKKDALEDLKKFNKGN